MSSVTMPPLGTSRDARAGCKCIDITKSDAFFLDEEVAGVYCGSDGILVISDRGGKITTFNGAKSGSVIPCAAVKVMAATTVTGLVGMV